MKPGQLALLGVAVTAVILIAGLGGRGGSVPQPGASAATADGSVRISFAYSPDKAKLLEPLIANYNAAGAMAGGKRVVVVGQNIASGDAESKIAAGRLKPTVWTPVSSLWGRLLNHESDRSYVPDENPSLVRTTLVIAMWAQMAEALGHPQRRLGFGDILRLARSDAGWGAFGHPEFGAFKLVHTNPDYSTSGLSAVVAQYYAASGKSEGLRLRDVARARPAVKDIEQSIVHYGDTSLFIAQQLRREGLGYASAVAMGEETLVDYNLHRGSRPKLVAIYPREGTFSFDHPYVVLDAPWVTRAQRRAAESFRAYLADKLDAATAARFGFRPADPRVKPRAPMTAANGVDPAEPRRVLGLPEPRVLAAMRKAWREDRKDANVLLVVDTSGSMNDERRLVNARKGLREFVRQAAPQDRIGLTIFSEEVRSLAPIAPVGPHRRGLQRLVRGLVADGGTAIYDATADAFDQVASLADSSRINAVVLLTDGEDTDSTTDVDAIVRRLAGQGDTTRRVRVFTIAYSSGAAGAADSLRRIAEASGGKAYSGDTDDIEAVYRSISSFF
jgi:Ca-activated chloride channel family protein